MSKQIQHPITDLELEQLLNDNDFAKVPEQFTQQVMASINALPQPVQQSQPTWWQWLALIGGGIPAFMQTIAFMFSAWNIASIG
jgi:hypothetical protein